ncbi:MAG: trypsin-like peptidase domain-containing protein, partial [Acidobacteriota bacterium]
LTVRDGAGSAVEVLRGRGPAGGDPFWGLAVRGDTAVFELRLRPGAGAVRGLDREPVRLDRVAVGDGDFSPFGPASGSAATKPVGESLCGDGDFEDIECYRGDAAKFDAMLSTAGVLTAENGSVFWCTGVNVSPRNLVLTAESCLASTAACRDAEFVFGYYRDGCGVGAPIADGWRGYRCLETVASSPFGDQCEPTPANLDFSLHRVDGDPANEWGWSDPADVAPASGERLYIPQHADGRPLEVAHGEGADVELDGMTLRYYGTLDTESSSVGAPIFRDSDDALVAMHHCGGCASPGVGNRGVLMADIRPEIEAFLCEPQLTVEGADAAPLEALDGNGDAVLDPGELWRLTPRLRNASCAAAAANLEAAVSVAAGSAPATPVSALTEVAALAPGETADGTPIDFRVDASAPCGADVVFDLGVITGDGGSFPGTAAYEAAPVGAVPETVLLAETFDGGLPEAWTVDDGGTAAGGFNTWTAADPGDRQLFQTGFAIVDSEFLGPDEVADEALTTPPVDTTAGAFVVLRFEHDFRHWDEGLAERADVAVRSTATAGAWVNIARYEAADARGPVELDLTPYRAADLQVRFRYSQAQWEWWWALDRVEIVGVDAAACAEFLFVDGFESGDTSRWSRAVP